MKQKAPFLLFCLLSQVFCLRAQDVHFSQFWETAVLRNPALTGVHDASLKAGVVYRSQWGAVAIPYQSTEAGIEARLSVGRHSSDYVTLSGLFYADKAGRAALRTTGFYPAIAYHKSLSGDDHSYLTAGFTAGYLQRSYDLSKLTFDNQYQGGTFVPSAGPGEGLPIQNLSYWDGGAGVSYNSSVGRTTTYYIGLSAYHFSRPRATFSVGAGELDLSMRWNGAVGVHVRLEGPWSVQLHGSFGRQGAYTETVGGGLLRWSRGGKAEGGGGYALSGGVLFRVGDAVVPVLKLDWGKMALGISYDVNTSYLKVASRLRGGLEVTAMFNGVTGGRRGGEGPRF